MMILPPEQKDSPSIRGDQVHHTTEGILRHSFPEVVMSGYRYSEEQVWDVLLYASTNRISIKAACQRLKDAPSYNWVYTFLTNQVWNRFGLNRIEQRVNDALISALPEGVDDRAHKTAADLTLIPYYGDEDTPEISRSQAKKSTTKFFSFASAYVIKKNKRVTLCVVFVSPEDSLMDVLTTLLDKVSRLNIRIKRLYLDREFARVDVFRYLSGKPYTSIVPVPKKGNKLKALQKGKKSYTTTYTMKSSQYGQISFPLMIACRYRMGRSKKHGIQYLFYAVLGPECKSTELQIAQEYRNRFGIESSFRIMNQARAKTTSTKAQMRLLLVGIAFLLQNVWVCLKWFIHLMTRRRHKNTPEFTLDQLCHFVTNRIEDLYGVVNAIQM